MSFRSPLSSKYKTEKSEMSQKLEVPQSELHKHDSSSTLNLPLHDSVEVQETDNSNATKLQPNGSPEVQQEESPGSSRNVLNLTLDTAPRQSSASPNGTTNEKGGFNERLVESPQSVTHKKLCEVDTEVGKYQDKYYPKVITAFRRSERDDGARTIVLCLDGTGDQFDGDNSNVVRFFKCLKKDDPNRQLVYYQAGLGTYLTTRSANPITTFLSGVGDMAIGSGLGHHTRDAYAFLMENYRQGDKICLVGFSRGAYTARCLAGMLTKVGLLPKGNREQIAFAYKMYKDTSEEGWDMSNLFKETFSIKVNVHWIGAWDSVSSIGFIPRELPFHKSNNAVKYFSHAVALDEHRAKFKAGHWTRAEETESRKGFFQRRKQSIEANFGDDLNEVDLDDVADECEDRENNELEKQRQLKLIDEKITEIRKQTAKGKKMSDVKIDNFNPEIQAQYELKYQLQNSGDFKDTKVKEVFFTGCHADVGGGAVLNHTRHSLAKIPLRWMLRQSFKCNTGLSFNTDDLDYYGISLKSLYPMVTRRPPVVEKMPEDKPQVPSNDNPRYQYTEEEEDYYDSLCDAHDYLKLTPAWWILELWPLREIYQDQKGRFRKRLAPNLGHHRTIRGDNIKFHRSVAIRQRRIGYKMGARMVDSNDTHWVG